MEADFGSSSRTMAASPSMGLLKNQIRTVNSFDDKGNCLVELMHLDHELSFDKGLFVFIRAVQTLRQACDGIVVVGLAGPSGAGKTIFSQKVRSFIPECSHLEMDMYNDGSKVIDANFDDPRLTDYDTLLSNIAGLKAGKAVDQPIYSFKESKRVGYRRVQPPASRVVIVEGIYALSSRLRPLMNLRVSIKGGVHFDLVKRVLRDIDRSGQQPEDILQQISQTVYPMYKIHIEPDLDSAHLRVVNNFNPFSGLQNATYTLKSSSPVTEEQCLEMLNEEEIKRCEQETLDIYLLPPNEDPETCQTWLRMRNRDGKYSLMFEEFVTDGPFIISPRITFEVGVRILGGLMALGYKTQVCMRRKSVVLEDSSLTFKLDHIEGLGRTYIQIQGKNREDVAQAGTTLGLDGTYVPHSYIEQVQLEDLTADFNNSLQDVIPGFSFSDSSNHSDGAVIHTSNFGQHPSRRSSPHPSNLINNQHFIPRHTRTPTPPSLPNVSMEGQVSEMSQQVTDMLKTQKELSEHMAGLMTQIAQTSRTSPDSLRWIGYGLAGASLAAIAASAVVVLVSLMKQKQ